MIENAATCPIKCMNFILGGEVTTISSWNDMAKTNCRDSIPDFCHKAIEWQSSSLKSVQPKSGQDGGVGKCSACLLP